MPAREETVTGGVFRATLALLICLAAAWAAQAQEGPRPSAAPPVPDAPPEKPDSRRWALLIGVNDYAEVRKLRFCSEDMRALAGQLVASGFPEQQIILLHDKAQRPEHRPTKAHIEGQLERVLGLVERDDLVVVAFSGHGVHFGGKSYLCPLEARLGEPETLVSMDVVYRRLRECDAALKLLLVDACREDPRPAGPKSQGPYEGTKQFAAELERPPRGILLLSSCAPGQISMEDKALGHGVFMHFLLEGLQGRADGDRNRRVSLLELYRYANRETKAYVARKYGGWQTPALKVDDLVEDFEFGVPRRPPSDPGFPLAGEGASLFEGHLDERGRLSPELARATGWAVLRGLRVTVLRLDAEQGTAVPTNPSRTLRTGDRFKLGIESPCCDLWVYVLGVGTSGKVSVLFPEGAEEHVMLRKGDQIALPPGTQRWRLSPPAGTENIRIVASPERLRWINPPELLALERGLGIGDAGDRLARHQEAQRTKSLSEVAARQGRMPTLKKPLAEALESYRSRAELRGKQKQVGLMPPPRGPEDPLRKFFLLVADAKDREPFAVDLELKHSPAP